MHEDEPVGYLGGEVGQNPYGDDEEVAGYLEGAQSPYGDDEEIAGYLEGAPGDDDAPMLPPVEEESAYSAKDFIDSDPNLDSYDPYAEDDPYSASGEDYGYDGYDPSSVAESDTSYFDEMAHTDEPATQKYAEEEYEDPDQPKTISQQDAESIIRRITTKRIVPPEAEARPRASVQPSLTPTGGGLRLWPLMLAFLVLGGIAVAVFHEDIGKQLHEMGFPEIGAMLGYEHVDEAQIDNITPTESPEARRTRLLKEMVLKSELKAFGVTEKDLKRSSAPSTSPTPGGSSAPPDRPSEGGE